MTVAQKFYNLQGKVSHQGLPVRNVKLELFEDQGQPVSYGQEPLEVQVTGQSGEFCFAVPRGLYAINVIPDGTTRFSRQTQSKIAVTANSDQLIILSTGNILDLAVRDVAGSRLDTLEVTATGINPYLAPITAGADGNGIYNLLLPRGRYSLSLKSKPDTKGAKYFFADSFTLDIKADMKHEILLPEMIKLKGYVYDSQNKRIPGAQVKVSASGSPASATIVFYSTDNGSFEIFAEPGQYDFEVQPPADYSLAGLYLKNRTIDETTEPLELSLPAGRKLTGQVQYNGNPLVNASVCVNSTETRLKATRNTDAEGKFSFGLPAGNYKLRVIPSRHSSGLDGAPAPWTRSVVLGGDTEVNVDIKEGWPLQIDVLSSRGRQRPLVDVAIYADTGGPPKGDRLDQALAIKKTDITGTAIFNLAPGRYWLAVNGQPSTLSDFTMPEKSHEIRFAWASGHIASFEIIDDKSNPVAGANVSWEPYSPDTVQQTKLPVGALGSEVTGGEAIADEKGRCQLNLPAGIYSFRFQADESSHLQPRSIRQLSIGQDIDKKVKLTGKKTAERQNVQLQLIETSD